MALFIRSPLPQSGSPVTVGESNSSQNWEIIVPMLYCVKLYYFSTNILNNIKTII